MIHQKSMSLLACIRLTLFDPTTTTTKRDTMTSFIICVGNNESGINNEEFGWLTWFSKQMRFDKVVEGRAR